MKAQELREKSDEELNRMIVEHHDNMMHFRMQTATGVVDNVRGARASRRDIARIKTILNERKREGENR